MNCGVILTICYYLHYLRPWKHFLNQLLTMSNFLPKLEQFWLFHVTNFCVFVCLLLLVWSGRISVGKKWWCLILALSIKCDQTTTICNSSYITHLTNLIFLEALNYYFLLLFLNIFKMPSSYTQYFFKLCIMYSNICAVGDVLDNLSSYKLYCVLLNCWTYRNIVLHLIHLCSWILSFSLHIF